MSAYLFNNKRGDEETNKLMGVVIFLILSLIFTIVISISIFLIYFDNYKSIQKQYSILEEKLQQVSVENYEKTSDYTKLNFELNEIKNEMDKLTNEKIIFGDTVKVSASFIESIDKGDFSEAAKYITEDMNKKGILKGYSFPKLILSGEFLLNDDLNSAKIEYFSVNEGEDNFKYSFSMVRVKDEWFIDNIEVFKEKPTKV